MSRRKQQVCEPGAAKRHLLRRERSPWRAIVTAGTETAAFNRLLDLVRGGDKCVLPAGADPNGTPPQTRRRRF